MSVVRTLSLRPTSCLVATAALAVAAAGTSVIVAGAPSLPDPSGPALRPLPPVSVGITASTPVTGPVRAGVTVDADPVVRTAEATVDEAADTATSLVADTVEQAGATVDRTLATAVPLVLDTAGQAVTDAIELAGTPISGTVTLCPGAVVSTGAHLRTGDLLVLRRISPTATVSAAGGLVSTPQPQPDQLAAAAGSDVAEIGRLVPLRVGVGSSWQTLPADGTATASTTAGPLSLATTGSTCTPFDWSLLR